MYTQPTHIPGVLGTMGGTNTLYELITSSCTLRTGGVKIRSRENKEVRLNWHHSVCSWCESSADWYLSTMQIPFSVKVSHPDVKTVNLEKSKKSLILNANACSLKARFPVSPFCEVVL